MFLVKSISNLRHQFRVLFSAILSLIMLSHAGYTFTFSDQNQKLVTDINAANGIICEQQENKCVAKGDVHVTRGQASLVTDQLTAFFQKNNLTSRLGKLSRLIADGHVIVNLKDQNQTATSEHAVYDIGAGELTMTGHNLRLETSNFTITAQDSLKYFEKDLIAVASGHAMAQQNDKTIKADQLKTSFKKAGDGKIQIDQFSAIGHVIITTPNESAYGDEGHYNYTSGLMTLEGNVQIHYHTGGNNLRSSGQRAEINMKTGHSHLLATSGSTSSDKRVKVLLTP